MKKSFKNINEEVDRIKKLFTEERLYGNLIIENIDEECNVEGTRLHKIKEILNNEFKIPSIEFDKDSTSCYIYFKMEIGEYKYKFFIWESRWFKFTKEKKDKSPFEDKLIGKTITQRISSGSYYLTPGINDLFFNEFKTDQYKDVNGKIENITKPIISTSNKSFKIYYESILQKKEEKLKTQYEKKFDIDSKSINVFLDGWITKDNLIEINKIIDKHIKNNIYCEFRDHYYAKYGEDLYEEISDITGLTELRKLINEILNKLNEQKCKKNN
jgi:hypothetical protein